MSFDVCVVGAGRMGASIAGHLALQGARVALFDRSDFDRCRELLVRACLCVAYLFVLKWLVALLGF